MPVGTQPYYRPQLPPNTSPSGRGIDPRTGIIGSMPGGMDYLAGFGPAPSGVNIPDMDPVVHGYSLPGQGQNHLQSFMAALARFQPSANRTPTPYTPINPYATPASNVAGAAAVKAAVPTGTNWWQSPGVFNNPTPPKPSAPGIQWGGSGMPYSQMSQNYSALTQGLSPSQILHMFPSTK